jgi:O-antigen ligase
MPPASPAAKSEAGDPLQSITFAFGLGLLVIRFSMLNQMLYMILHFNPFLMYVFEIPVLIGLALTGGIWRSFRGSPAYYWTGYGLWMAAVTPFSTWRSGSLHVVWGFWKVELPVLFVIAGLALTWRACQMVMHAIAWGGLLSVAAGHFFRNQSSGSERLEITFGTVANANDYACVLLLMLPFVLWLALSSKTIVVRVAIYAAVTAGLYMILSTGSRGAMLSLSAEILFFLYRGTMRQRMALLILAPLAVGVAVAGISEHLKSRILSFSTADSGSQAEAAESLALRQYELRKTIEYTIANPVLGLGPGQFSTYEGTNNKTVGGRRGTWMDAHNSYLQASSECGIPGLLLFLAGFLSSGHLLSKTYRKARQRPDCGDIRAAVFSVMLGMTGFCVAITFLNFAYLFYGPALGGLAIAMSSAAEHEFERRGAEAGQAGAPVLPTRAGSSRGQVWTA